jgi:hypothetical protein
MLHSSRISWARAVEEGRGERVAARDVWLGGSRRVRWTIR